MKVVFDTNVLVAPFLSEGVCYKLLLRARKKEYELVLSPDIVAEFEGVLLRKFALSQSELTDVRTLLAEAIDQVCLEVDPIEPVSRDPDDDKILACASVSQADYLATGDEDLLVVRQYGGTKILAPRDFESLFAD